MSVGWAASVTLIGAVVLGHAALCWSGRLRAWSRRVWWDQWVLGLAPGIGAMLLGFGLLRLLGEPVGTAVGSLLVVSGWALLVPGMLYLLFTPRWWGPRWFRRLSARERRPDIRDPLTALLVVGSARPRRSSREAAAREAAGYGPALASWRAGYVYDPDSRQRAHGMAWRGTTTGRLTLYRDGLTFAAAGFEDVLRGRPTVVALPAGEITTVRVVPPRAGADGVPRRGVLWRSPLPRLVIGTGGGREYVVEVTSARRVARRVDAFVPHGAAGE